MKGDNIIFTGTITRGEGKASALGFPTINIPITDESLSGIYAGEVTLEQGTYRAACYVDQKRMILEAHLIGFSGAAAGAATMRLHAKLRDHREFEDDRALCLAIADDVKKAETYVYGNH